ncbi:MgtC/SapB family protein [Dyella sp.]|uniref:MgtC/SapB family protein n=1 Tax=Dyella sp. TaxID=1869338 RepID=UPI002ED3F48F
MIDYPDLLLRLIVAAILSGVIGANRGRLEWSAGLRTHMLVGVGSALAIIVSAYGFRHALTFDHAVLDPSRIAAQVISGIGFLGAGTILFSQRDQVVRGLTTAAGLWAVATVGLAAGAGLYAAAVTATLLLWIILAMLKPIERRFVRPRPQHFAISMELSTASSLSVVERVLEDFHAPVRQIRLRRHQDGHDVVEIRFMGAIDMARMAEIADACRKIDGAQAVNVSQPVVQRG